jgi:hypothetical protein
VGTPSNVATWWAKAAATWPIVASSIRTTPAASTPGTVGVAHIRLANLTLWYHKSSLQQISTLFLYQFHIHVPRFRMVTAPHAGYMNELDGTAWPPLSRSTSGCSSRLHRARPTTTKYHN